MAVQGASSSSLSSFTHRCKYDVFLSFRGEDTRNNFTAHLYAALVQKGINTYRDDDKLQRGEEISQALSEAIESSRISVVVLSEKYASSRWCLEELAMIIDSKKTKQQTVLPVFYEIDPTDVRHQSGSFGKAWAELKDKIKDETKVQRWESALTKVAGLAGFTSVGRYFAKLKDKIKDETKVQRWESALTEVAGLAGFTSVGRNEHEFIQEFVLKVSRSVNCKCSTMDVSKHLVGMQSRVKDIHYNILSVELNATPCMLGIFGNDGVGKTTLAKVIYNNFIDKFENSCFLANVRETLEQEKGLIQLQETLLREILRDSSLNVRETLKQEKGLIQLQKTVLREILRDSSLKDQDNDKRIHLIKSMISGKTVLLLLDDVDHWSQIEMLLGDQDWRLGLGSLIIITTRDEHLLTSNNVHLQYKMKELDHNDALQLFCWKAFKNKEPNQGFAELTEKFLRYAGRLPLALKVLGSYLSKREEIKFWEDALEKYKRIPPDNILRIGYDGLEESEKNIFLDIACFFAGKHEGYVTNILNGCGFFSHAGIPILREKSLITIDEYGIVNMHDLLKVMGKEIVRKESDKDPGKRTRLWFHEDVRYVLEQNKGTNNTDLPKEDLIHLSPGAFEKMPNLRVLINRNALFLEQLNFLSNELRVLDFDNYHGPSLPSNFNGKKLVDLGMTSLLGNKFKNLQNLKFLKLIKRNFLPRIPNTSSFPNLEQLDILGCHGLVEIDQSIGSLSKLVRLSIRFCCKLNSFPSPLNSRSLTELIVESCPSLVSFPEIGLEMKCLKSITWRVTGVEELPSSIGNLTELRELDLRGNNNLAHIPSSILQLEHLRHLYLDPEPFTLAKGSLQLLFRCYVDEALLKSCGVHLVRKDKENAKRKRDDDDDCNFESNWYRQQKRHFYEDDGDDDNSMDDNLEDGVLLNCGVHLLRKDEENAKRKRDDDCNLESNWYPQEKRHYSNDNDDDEHYYSMDDEHYYSTEEAIFNSDED